MPRNRLTALLACATLVPLSAVATATPGASAQQAAAGAPATGYSATITRTAHGIPHVTADSFGDLGFGSGYAAAETSICTLADTLVTGRAQRSRWFGPEARYNDQVTLEASNLQVDAFVQDLHNRRVVEKLLADEDRGPGPEARQMVRGYVAGVNRYLDRVGPSGVGDPECRGAGYLRQDARPIDLWYGVYLANLLASSGVFVKEIVDADPPSPDDPGIPNPTAAAVDRDALLTGLGRDPSAPFGSNATAVGGDATTTGKGMLLGNPHFPWRGRYRFTQQHLTIPGEYDVAGASLIGSPVVNIGWNKDVAWSHTVSTAYRFTPYEYRLAGPTTYLTDSGPQELQRREVTVTVRRDDGSLAKVKEDLYRTPEGYVIDAPALLMPWSVASVWAIRDANAEHLRTVDTFLQMGKATDVRDLLARQDEAAGMPWVNTTAADRNGDALYADHSVVPHVTDEMADQCMTPTGRILDGLAGLPGLDGTRASSGCRWGTDEDASRSGVFGPGNLPYAIRRDWLANANDSYWLPHPDERLEGYDHIIGCERCERTMRTRMVYRYIQDRLAGGDGLAPHQLESPATLRGHEHENRLMAAEVMRANGDLDTLCESTGEERACQVLHDWDGRSERSSRGTHIFEEFVARLPDQGVWRTPFDPAEPLTTPRDLNILNPLVRQAMADAIDSLRQRGIPFDATWGSLQVAGDRGASPIALGGGTGDSVGNANALASRWPEDNTDRYRPITYGSSHIQAISFLAGGGLDARTILTYGQSEDPTSPWSEDQTRIFGRGEWVHFPWTDEEIVEQTVSEYLVTSP
ncbi:penicillin acylase family protein [Nocardioides sp.]|uniref:penicillin acylase family protein n=1 Tax=Nocardioides sp. TaxID=35761 RepID=UPI002D80AB4E|nr:penicillin acylase family protein [Nocardioides sp.]HET8961419.1 penicillin acylase family protein [Nocardioides sp.]